MGGGAGVYYIKDITEKKRMEGKTEEYMKRLTELGK